MQHSIIIPRYRAWHEPTQAQKESGNYKKREIAWRGLTIAVETPAGTLRSGTDRTGKAWEVRIPFDYGYFKRTEGVDGDAVDCFIGPDLDEPVVYIVRQRKAGNWTEYDEDKVMVGFDSEESARAAFLSAYKDPRFLGEIAAMPAEEFVSKVRATNGEPGMVKSVVLFFDKSFVRGYTRGDGTAVQPHNNRIVAKPKKETKWDKFKRVAGEVAGAASDAITSISPGEMLAGGFILKSDDVVLVFQQKGRT